MLFLMAVGATYGMAGTLNMAELHLRMASLYQSHPAAVTAVGVTLAIAFALKAALFPLYFWLPASYHAPAAATCALFAAILTKVGLYALVRIFTLPFAGIESVYRMVLVLATITMLSGVLGAVTQVEIKRILAWHSISQVGYIAVGIGLLASESHEVRSAGLAATLFFAVHHGLIKPALFLVAGLIHKTARTTQLKPLGGLLHTRPLIAGAFAMAALSLAGVPPLSGFWAKLAVIRAGVLAERPIVVAVMLATGLLTLLSMLKIWNEAFWKSEHSSPASVHPPRTLPRFMWGPTIALVALATFIGLFPGPLLTLSENAARRALNPDAYVGAVDLAFPNERATIATPDEMRRSP
jgi:multicomponent Na+:H+ antiporter subunit D